MKKKYNYLLVFVALMLSFGCEQSELITYESRNQIYFYDTGGTSGAMKDSTTFSFANMPLGTTDTVVQIPLRIVGAAADVDRAFQLEVDAENTTAQAGLHYEILTDQLVVSSGLTTASVPVRVMYQGDMDSRVYLLKMRLLANENFDVNINYIVGGVQMNVSTYDLYITNTLIQPTWWTGLILTAYLGDFSVRKIELITELTGYTLETLVGLTNDQYFAIALIVQQYLLQNTAAGTPVLDENGEPINMGSYVF